MAETERPKLPLEVDHAILNDPTLGSASHLPYLDEVEEQLAENRRARAEGREPKKVSPRARNLEEVVPGKQTTDHEYNQEQATEQVNREKVEGNKNIAKGTATPVEEQTEEEREANTDQRQDSGPAVNVDLARENKALEEKGKS